MRGAIEIHKYNAT